MSIAALRPDEPVEPFRHEALFYAGLDGFVSACAAFLTEGIAVGEPALVAVTPDKIAALREAVDGPDDLVSYVDMAELGRNPARIIPAWVAFAGDRRAERPRLRGIGEPIWATRSAAELAECQRHEALINLAFAGAEDFRLVCPYDVTALPAPVIEEARRSHPLLGDGTEVYDSPTYEPVAARDSRPLPEPVVPTQELLFRRGPLDLVRLHVARRATAFGLGVRRVDDLELAVSEVAANSIRHGGGRGLLRTWVEADTLIAEIRDAGTLDEPLAGRHAPAPDQEGGWGLWLVNQLVDLAQIRTSENGTVVRLHMTRGRHG